MTPTGLPPHIPITQAGIALRPPHPDHCEALFRNVTQSEEVTRYLSWAAHRTSTETTRFLTTIATSDETTSDITWIITTDDDTPIGMFSCWFDSSYSIEVGFCLGEQWWNQGIMTATLSTIITMIRHLPSIYRVWATCDPQNLRSAAVLHRAGFTHEGTLARHAMRPNLSPQPRSSELYGLALK